MSTQTRFLCMLSRKQISRNLRVFGVNFELMFFICVKKLTLCNSDIISSHLFSFFYFLHTFLISDISLIQSRLPEILLNKSSCKCPLSRRNFMSLEKQFWSTHWNPLTDAKSTPLCMITDQTRRGKLYNFPQRHSYVQIFT